MTNAKILVADDDRNICELLRMNLEKEGYTVVLAGNGKKPFQNLMKKTPILFCST